MIMGWMMDEYSKMARQRTPAVITGKPIPLGGSLGRAGATGRGAYYCLKELEARKAWKPGAVRVAIQGFGNAGQEVARLLWQDGYRIVAVSDSKGGIFNKERLDIPALIEAKNRREALNRVYCDGLVCDLSKARPITNEAFLELDVEVLIQSAMENQITKANAARIQAGVILEIANGPTTSEADLLLNRRGRLVVPDILANAGGVTVSYFEWTQNRTGYYWKEEEVHARLQEIMSREFQLVYTLMETKKIDMRTAAYVHGLNRIGLGMDSLGTQKYYQDAG
jgi:glutamate dehydrogenase (NADP+)